MDNKFNWTELRKAVAQQLGTKENEVNTFLQAYSAAIEQGLKQDGQVRINNLGTFKVQQVAPRKSVNVTTGEAFIIPGYNKIAFTPEAAIKELVTNVTNHSSSTKMVTHPLEKLNEQATEIVDILADLGQSPTQVKAEKVEEVPEVLKVEEVPEVEEVPKGEKAKKAETVKPKNRSWLTVSMTLLIIIVLMVGGFLIGGGKLVGWLCGYTGVEPFDEAAMALDDIEEIESDVPQAPVSTLPYPITYNQFIAIERLPKGSRLAWLARKYYGERDMWVFIYEANRDHVTNPSHIVIGTPIRVPKLPKELLDLSNPETRQLVDRLIEEYKQNP